MDVEETTRGGNAAQQGDSTTGNTKARPLFDRAGKVAGKANQQALAESPARADVSADGKFVPTCEICGEKHWPFHALVPCINIKKAKAKAKEKKRALARARKKAKAEAKAKAIAKKDARAEAIENGKIVGLIHAAGSQKRGRWQAQHFPPGPLIG